IQPKLFRRVLKRYEGDRVAAENYLSSRYGLFELFRILGDYQDKIKRSYFNMEIADDFNDWDLYMDDQLNKINTEYKKSIRYTIHNTYFYNVVFPLVFKSIKASILEYQAQVSEEEVELAEEAI
ncbi:MAG: hypothetical protein HC888_15870, partial [Candidatus Competibacteraceae bacterium]|nr:hypothetical protein [Candidatus Competibacteraceae bacterium]